ncbi:hypothetical protein VTK26DRAFT_3495 [Humicola hyalothermophila]
MARRQHLTLTLAAMLLFLGFTCFMSSTSDADRYATRLNNDFFDHTSDGSSHSSHTTSESSFGSGLSESILKGGSIAPKLENATAKAELGRASWKLLHTMMARFPEEPTAEDSLALKTYVQLFARLYPCGDCAAHFRKLLERYPPQTSSRNAAAGWACFVHNEVNKRLHKEQFDCSKIGDFYDCGCGDEDKEKKGEGKRKEEEEEEDGEGVIARKGVTQGGEAGNTTGTGTGTETETVTEGRDA